MEMSCTLLAFDSTMSKVTDEDVRRTVKALDDHIRKEYIETHPEKERDWRTYEQQFSKRIRDAIKALDPLIHEAVSTIRIEPRTGREARLAHLRWSRGSSSFSSSSSWASRTGCSRTCSTSSRCSRG
jgi:hypothetical protein